MKIILQRVSKASVRVDDEVVGKIGKGVVLLLGVAETDTGEEIDYLVNKILNLRIFRKENQYFEESLLEIKGEILVVSQFTLYGTCDKGRRPDFTQAAKSEKAKRIYLDYVERMKNSGLKVETGVFGADMQVELINDGPVTLVLER